MNQRDELLQRYFDGEMYYDERAAFEKTLTELDRERLAALAEVRILLINTLDAEAERFDVWPSIHARLGAKTRAPTRRWRASRAYASAGLVMAAAAVLFFLIRPAPPPERRAGAVVERIEVQGAAVALLSGGGDDDVPVIWMEEDE